MALLPKPPQMLGELRDKYQHMLAFATLAGLAGVAMPRMSLWMIGERLSFLGALIEVFQAIPALHRDCDPVDWIADTVAVVAVLVLFKLLRLRE